MHSATGSPGALLRAKLGIQDRESGLVVWGAVCLALVGWSDVSLANVAETLFLKRVGVEWLPVAFLLSSLLMVASTYTIVHLIARGNRAQLLTRVFALLALGCLPLWAIVWLDLPGAFVLLILVSKQVKVIALLVFFVTLGDWLHARQAKRLFAPLMTGLTLGTIAGSFASQHIGQALGLDGVLYTTSGVLALGAGATLRLRRARPSRLERGLGGAELPSSPFEGPRLETSEQSLRQLWRRSGLFQLLLLTTFASGILAPLLYFQFAYVADLSTQGESGEQRLLALYAQLRGWIYVAILVTQLGVTSNLYRRIGVALSAGLFPVVYILGFLGLSVWLSLWAGVAALSAARLHGKAIYEPALRVLFNLFPDELRPRVAALLEGPVDRLGGALGNVVVLAALALGTPVWVGYFGIPIAAGWVVVAAILWWRYPTLLLASAAGHTSRGDAREPAELVDPATLRVLSAQLVDPDSARCRVAVELVCDATPERALEALAGALPQAPDANRPLLIAGLDRILEREVAAPRECRAAARSLEPLLASPSTLRDGDRADLVQAWARLIGPRDDELSDVLERAARDPAPAVRLAALAALRRGGGATSSASELDRALAESLAGEDAAARRTAREELRTLLLTSPLDARWEARVDLLATLLLRPSDRVAAAEALADVARGRGGRTARVRDAMKAWEQERDPALRAALLRFCGHAGLVDQAPWLVEHLVGHPAGVADAAREGLVALGSAVVTTLLVEHAYGKRSTRDAILEIVRELDIEQQTLRGLYEHEIEGLRRTLLSLHALEGRRDAHSDSGPSFSPIVRQRLEERMGEGLHATLLFLTAIHHEDRIAELDHLLRRDRGTRRAAILLEALESLLSSREREDLLPLLDDAPLELRARAAAARLGVSLPSFLTAGRALLEDPDNLTRQLAVATWPKGLDRDGDLARAAYLNDHQGVLDTVEVALQLKLIPLFERLSMRQLMDLAEVVQEESHDAGTVICREGEEGRCMYLVVEGDVEVRARETLLATMGPESFFGEMALFDGVDRSATVVTNGRVRLLRLERDDMLSLMEEHPAIAIAICQALSGRVRDMNVRV